MQKRAGLLFLAKDTKRILLILENSKWTVPTFTRQSTLLDDALVLLNSYSIGKIIPIELFISNDREFEYGTYICLVEKEFSTLSAETIAWCSLDYFPKQIHPGLTATLNSSITKSKILTILEINN